jgi:hypothetical protein
MNQGTITHNDHVNPILLVEDRPTDLDLTKRAFAKRRLLNPIEVARNDEEVLAFIPGGMVANQPRSLSCLT